MPAPSPIAMRLSLFRTKSNTSNPSPSPKRRLSAMWSPTRPKSDAGGAASPADGHLAPAAAAAGVSANAGSYSTSSPSNDAASSGPGSDLPALSSPRKFQNVGAADDRSDVDNLPSDSSRMDERDLERRLMDVESSFLPDNRASSSSPHNLQPYSPQSNRHPERSPRSRPLTFDRNSEYMFDASQQEATPPKPDFARSPTSTTTPPRNRTPQTARLHSYRNTAPPGDVAGDYADSPLDYSPQYNTLSSPTAAAAQRSRLRTSTAAVGDRGSWRTSASSRTITTVEEPRDPVLRAPPQHSSRLEKPPTAPAEADTSSAAEQTGEHDTNDSTGRQGAPLNKPGQSSSHHSRQQSSTSSYISDAPSEATIGADFALQSGGAAPGRDGGSIRPSYELSRLPSFGSIASSISGGTDGNGVRSRKRTASTALLPTNQEREADDEATPGKTDMETPRASTFETAQPTDTVLAQHVRDVEVPDTVARQFRAANIDGGIEPKPMLSTPYYSRGKNNLTLKEQNSKIDKLSKENFDLKLKIHYLHQALQDRSDEGVKDLVSKNAQLQADLVNVKKDNQTLRKRIKVLEKGQAGQDRGLAESYGGSEEGRSTRSHIQAQMEDEIIFLRDRMQQLENENQRMSKAALTRAGQSGAGTHADALRDALEKESSQRNQAEQQLQTVKDELAALKRNRSPMPRLRLQASDANLSTQSGSRYVDNRQSTQYGADEGSVSGSTLVDQLRQENAGLRRDLGAQASMLTSRNRERERLQQEIEDLKLVQRRGEGDRSASGDSIFDRSVSRNNQRSTSRASGSARLSHVGDHDRDHYESVHATLRDENAMLKMRNQDLQKELNEQRDSAEYLQMLEAEGETTARELDEARAELEYLEDIVIQKDDDIAQLLADLRGREEETGALQLEIKAIGDSLNRLVDDSEANQGLIQSLQQDLENASGELEGMDATLRDTAEAKERLEVQAESSQSEIAFLREEQESDKIRISDLQAALRNVQTDLSGEKERLKAFEELEAESARAKDEARRLRKSLSDMETQASHAKSGLDEIETGLRRVFGKPDARGSSLVQEVAAIQGQLESTLQDLEHARFDLSDKDRLLSDRESLLETSSNENRRLNDLLAKERLGRHHDRNEFERIQRTGPQARLAELERARAEDKEKVATLQQALTSHTKQKNELLLSIWTRLADLCGPEWAQRHGLGGVHGGDVTAESIASDLPTFNKNLVLAIKTIERVIASFRARLRSTEGEIMKEYQSLEHALEQRTRRLDNIERAVRRGLAAENSKDTATEDSAAAEQVSRLKHENKSLRRELKFLKQGSFSLPGLPSPSVADRKRDFDLTGPPPFVHSSSASAVPERRSSKNAHSSAYGFGLAQQDSSNGRPSADATQDAELRIDPSAGQSSTNEEDEVFHDSHQEQPGEHAQRLASAATSSRQLGLTAPYSSATAVALGHDQQQHGAEGQDAPVAPSEQRLVLQLEELSRRLHKEREGRLIDREGARTRLKKGLEQVDGLRKELERERGRSRPTTATGPAPEGAAAQQKPMLETELD